MCVVPYLRAAVCDQVFIDPTQSGPPPQCTSLRPNPPQSTPVHPKPPHCTPVHPNSPQFTPIRLHPPPSTSIHLTAPHRSLRPGPVSPVRLGRCLVPSLPACPQARLRACALILWRRSCPLAPITALTPAQSARCRRIRHVRHVQHVRQEYRRYPVVDNEGQNWEEMGRYFSCNSVWMTSRLVDKCCHVPRCACCTKDGTTHGIYSHVPPTVSPLASPLLALVAPRLPPFFPCSPATRLASPWGI